MGVISAVLGSTKVCMDTGVTSLILKTIIFKCPVHFTFQIHCPLIYLLMYLLNVWAANWYYLFSIIHHILWSLVYLVYCTSRNTLLKNVFALLCVYVCMLVKVSIIPLLSVLHSSASVCQSSLPESARCELLHFWWRQTVPFS